MLLEERINMWMRLNEKCGDHIQITKRATQVGQTKMENDAKSWGQREN